jgi:hypothetical protein
MKTVPDIALQMPGQVGLRLQAIGYIPPHLCIWCLELNQVLVGCLLA